MCTNNLVNKYLGEDDYVICGTQCIGLRSCICCMIIAIGLLIGFFLLLETTGA